MKLSRMELDMGKRRTLLALSCPSIFHGIVERAFSGQREHALWRIDSLRGKNYLMILSTEAPDLTEAVLQVGIDGESWESKDYSPLLNRIRDGSSWNFRLVANPTYSESRPGQRGKVHAHRTPEHQAQWLTEQGKRNGFAVTMDSFVITESRWYQFGKGNPGSREAQVRLLGVTYEGNLTVTDTEKFRKVLCCGLGREKAYGMGLMTVVSREN